MLAQLKSLQNIPISGINFGTLIGEQTFLILKSIGHGLTEPLQLVLNLQQRELTIYFEVVVYNRRQPSPEDSRANIHNYRLRVSLAQIKRAYELRDQSRDSICHILVLDSPPTYHRRLKNLRTTFAGSDTSWKDANTWYRQTDIVHNPTDLARLPTSLRKHTPIINLGRWTSIQIIHATGSEDFESYKMALQALQDFNVTIQKDHNFKVQSQKVFPIPVVWDVIDPPEPMKSSNLHDLIQDGYIALPFSVRYQLEVCISHCYISEYTAGREFAKRLLALGEKKARTLLEHVAVERKIHHDPMEIFDIKFPKPTTTAKIPPYCCVMRSATVTPTSVYYHSPSVDISNRVIRHFIEFSDRFLRVRFKDEKLNGRINSTENDTMDEVFTRIKRTMANGITLGDRHYEFLAFGNSQFREHGAYFFASLPNLNAANIRAWMGQFEDIRNIAKYAARLGQCFSTTRAVTACSVQVREIKDVERNGYTFSDGVGRMSKFLAQMTANQLGIKTPDGEPPSAFQFRLGGCKGMLVVTPQAKNQEIHIRPSQHKFSTGHQGLEIIRWSQFCMAHLNRQLIAVLSTLGVPDDVFHDKLQVMLTNLDEILVDRNHAMYLLRKYIDPNQMTLTISQMVSDGFYETKEPFFMSLLALWRAWQVKYLKEKAKIVIDRGACLLGVMDESAILKGLSYDNIPGPGASYEEKVAALPEIFVQVYRADAGKYEVVEGICIIARNPSLHPGDIRVVRAVNCPQLSHLKDVVVLPQLGDRDIASMCSGGDLDGDDYLVIWDTDLLPNDWFRQPMDYSSAKGVELDRPVTVNDVTSFFVTYMKNDCLPRIALAHLAWADYLEGGVEERKCIRLAKLHSDAVDYNKTGNPARMTPDLRPRRWPHFMERQSKSGSNIYKSNRILGQLYDAVDRVEFVPRYDEPFDERVLNSGIVVGEELFEFARQLKVDYDLALRRIMVQQEIKSEFEVWSTFAMSHANLTKDYRLHEELGNISRSLRDRFRRECYEKVGGRNFEQLAPLVVAMYKVTYEEVTEALERFQKENPFNPEMSFEPAKPDPSRFPFISFPWLFPEILGKIALGDFDEKDEQLIGSQGEQQDQGKVKLKQEDQEDHQDALKKTNNHEAQMAVSSLEEPALTNLGWEGERDIVEEEGEVQPNAMDVIAKMLEEC